jgi:hypothetical protein
LVTDVRIKLYLSESGVIIKLTLYEERCMGSKGLIKVAIIKN